MVISFTVGVYAQGVGLLATPWSEIETSVKGNTDALIDGLEDEIALQVDEFLNGTVNNEIVRANNEIGIYYNDILWDLEENPKINSLKGDLKRMTSTLIADEKARIDDAIANVLGQ